MIIFSMLIFSVWALFFFYNFKSCDEPHCKSVFRLYILLYVLGGLLLIGILVGLKSKITFFSIGGLILISGLRLLGILEHDLLYFLEQKMEPRNQTVVKGWVIFSVHLVYLIEIKSSLQDVLLFYSVMIILMAGFLLLIFLKKRRKCLTWQSELSSTLAGLFLLIQGLIIMSGDVKFFYAVFEKILHIN